MGKIFYHTCSPPPPGCWQYQQPFQRPISTWHRRECQGAGTGGTSLAETPGVNQVEIIIMNNNNNNNTFWTFRQHHTAMLPPFTNRPLRTSAKSPSFKTQRCSLPLILTIKNVRNIIVIQNWMCLLVFFDAGCGSRGLTGVNFPHAIKFFA